MIVIRPEVYIENQDWAAMLTSIEKKGRVCYKSEDLITDQSAEKFIESLIARGHHSVLEHSSFSVKFVVDRGVSHEIVRHRIASYSQESTRYCNYSQGKFGNEITVIFPFFFDDNVVELEAWARACEFSEQMYQKLLSQGATPQEARSVLPNSLKTEVWMTANLREWMKFFELRAASSAHPQMRQVAIPLLLTMKTLLKPIFGHIKFDSGFNQEHFAFVQLSR